MKKIFAGLVLGASVMLPSIAAAQVVPVVPPVVVVEEKSGGSSAGACYYLIGLGAKNCSNTPEVQALWAQEEVRDAIRQLYVLSLFWR